MRGLALRLDGQHIRRALVNRPDLRRIVPPELAMALTGAAVAGFRRRAKYILMRLRHGTGPARSMLLHLGMSGRIAIGRHAPDPPVPHEHLVIETAHGWRIALVDPRRFGSIDLVPTAAEDEHALLRHLGPEPLDAAFTPATLAAALAGRRGPIKTTLLDQRVVAGLGNIYVCEALFRAQLHPARPAGGLTTAEIAVLAPAIRAVLTEAIAAGGSSLRDYAQPSGELGYFQHAWSVYGRAGAPCPRCPGPPACGGVARMAQGGRSTFFCPHTQH